MRTLLYRIMALPLLLLLTAAPASYAKSGAGIVEWSGIVQSMPSGGLAGNWNVAGKAFRADSTTQFDQEDGTIAVGSLVEVKAAVQADSSLLAQDVEFKQGTGGGGNPGGTPGAGGNGESGNSGSGHGGSGDGGELTGAIETLPAGGMIGTWQVAGHAVIVVAETRIDLEEGTVAVGVIVEVHGTPDSTGAILASDIEVKGTGGTTTGTGGPGSSVGGRTELVGTIEALPATGLIGMWTVAGQSFTVDATTALDSEHGPLAVGTTVEVNAAKQADGTLLARKIESRPGQGSPVPQARFWGHVVALPGTGFIGLWKVDDKVVDVSATTELNVDNGPIVLDAIVEVHGWVQPDGVIAAQEIETAATIGAMPGEGAVAVEFFNPQLGHFFVTAAPAEIAALDAGTQWQRTGESFKAGGTQAVCRFYGMPPRGPDSHFFTANPAECANVASEYSAWTFEGHTFSTTPPDATGQCPAGLLPVHRLYNQASQGSDMNHRYVVNPAALAATLGMGWIDEGVVMCAQP